jgi:Domain of unknown function (DUF397).
MSTSAAWQKSSFSGNADGTDCLELSATDGAIHLRESNNPEAIITTSPAKLKAFILGVKAGEFDHFTA